VVWISTPGATSAVTIGAVVTRSVLVWQIWQRDSSCAGGHFAPTGDSMCGSWERGCAISSVGHTAMAAMWQKSAAVHARRRSNDWGAGTVVYSTT
jgi:hypothetical protein